MESELIESLRRYRSRLAAEIGARGFAQRSDRNKVLAASLATDRLLAALVEPLPPAGLDEEVMEVMNGH